MSRSIKTNFIFNLINTVSALLFPLITFPYASRILLADGIGQVQFFNSIIDYIILLTSLGIPLYGIKEIARVRDDKTELSRTTAELLLLSVLLSIVGYVIVAILCCTVGSIQDNIPLFLILSASILLTSLGCPWFYRGIEEFKYITLLNIAVKTLCTLFLLCFIKTKEDLLLYGVYSVFCTIGNYIVNFILLRKHISFKGLSLKSINCWKHIKPASAVFLFNIITSIYINLDTVMLGFLSDNTAVGYYTGATKISHILVILVTSLGTVLLPKTANLLKNNRTEEFYDITLKSFNFITMLSFPILCGLLLLSPSIVLLICGPGFAPSVPALRIISPIVIFIGISNLIGIQVLYPMGKIRLVTISIGIGAAVNLLLNFLLIPRLMHNGAALATVLAEFSVTTAQYLMVRKLLPFKLFSKRTLSYLFSAIIMTAACYLIMMIPNGNLPKILFTAFAGVLVYGGLMIAFKDELSLDIINRIKGSLHI